MLSHFGLFVLCVCVRERVSMRTSCTHVFRVCFGDTCVCVIVYIMFSWSNKPRHASQKNSWGSSVPLIVGQIFRREENTTTLYPKTLKSAPEEVQIRKDKIINV